METTLKERERIISQQQSKLKESETMISQHEIELRTLKMAQEDHVDTLPRELALLSRMGFTPAKQLQLHASSELLALHETLRERDERIAHLQQEILTWKDDVEQLEERVQGLIEMQRATEDGRARRELEQELRVRPLRLVKRIRVRTLVDPASVPLPPSPVKSDDAQSVNAPVVYYDAIPLERAHRQIQKLEEKVEAQAKDIGLYKLDVRGYKKDVRERDETIKKLQHRILELQSRLGGDEADVLISEVPLGIDRAGSSGTSTPTSTSTVPSTLAWTPPPTRPPPPIPSAALPQEPQELPASLPTPLQIPARSPVQSPGPSPVRSPRQSQSPAQSPLQSSAQSPVRSPQRSPRTPPSPLESKSLKAAPRPAPKPASLAFPHQPLVSSSSSVNQPASANNNYHHRLRAPPAIPRFEPIMEESITLPDSPTLASIPIIPFTRRWKRAETKDSRGGGGGGEGGTARPVLRRPSSMGEMSTSPSLPSPTTPKEGGRKGSSLWMVHNAESDDELPMQLPDPFT